MTHRITLIPGDGIGPEVTKATVRILEATGVKFEWETYSHPALTRGRRPDRRTDRKRHECAIFEAVHGSAPDIAGKNIANPTAVLRSAFLMLRHIGEADAAWKIRNAIDQVYRDRNKLTRDVGGSAGTSEFADAIIQAMESAKSAGAEKF